MCIKYNFCRDFNFGKLNFNDLLFSSIAHVIDNKETWGGKYPLAQMVLGSPDYRLVYQEVLNGCRHGDNIYTVLALEQNNFSVTNYHPVTKTLVRILYYVVQVWQFERDKFVLLE